MNAETRTTILNRLRSAGQRPIAVRPPVPSLRETALPHAKVVEQFCAKLAAQGGVPVHVPDEPVLSQKLAEILAQEKIARVMVTTDAVVAKLDWQVWSRQSGIEVVRPSDFSDRGSYTRAVFDQVGAGISCADFAAAESGTLIVVHDRHNARLVSLAPLVHIAVVRGECIIPAYETAFASIYGDGARPSQVTFITGPSMTSDIQGVPFKGMHGPQKLFVFILD